VVRGHVETLQFVGSDNHLVARSFWLLALFLISVACAFAFFQGNKFPAMWHPDEQWKAEQIISGEPAFHNPVLLLYLTKLVLAVKTSHPTVDEVVVAGRQVSAIAAALAVLMLALAAARLNGYLASLFVAVIVGSCSLLFGLAHYMKEDCVFVLALSLFVLSVVLFDEKPSTLRLLGMSISAGLIVSAKYIGVLTVPIALGLLIWKWRDRRPLGLIACLSGVLITFLIVGAPFSSFNEFRAGLGFATAHVTSSHHGFVWPISSPVYLVNLVTLISPIIVAAYILWLFLLYRNRERVSAAQVVIALLPILFLVVLQISPVKIIRYELPVLMLIGFGGACALASLARSPNWKIRLLVAFAFAGSLIWNVGKVYQSWVAITHDTRAEMARWIDEHIPKSAVIAQEGEYWRAIEGGNLSQPELGRVSVRVVMPPIPWTGEGIQLFNYGSIDGARRAGVTHILLQQGIIGCYVDPSTEVLKDSQTQARVSEVRKFYETLMREAPIVHHVDSRTPPGTFFSPALWLFCITCEPTPVPSHKVEYGVSCLN
jgi:Dolichyl-phosphate-mannose-protein mannosyltransferase